MATAERTAAAHDGHVPSPPSERRAWMLACALAVLGAGVLVALLTGAVGRSTAPVVRPVTPPAVPAVAPAPLAPTALAGALSSAPSRSAARQAAIVGHRSRAEQARDAQRFIDQTRTHISTAWMEGFYPIYAVAQRTFGVNWLLIASIHRQESAFSTAPGIYHGLNFAHCCGGPMQFNVTNGPISTWQLVADSYIYGARPRSYDHKTPLHPSLYDDFDSIMAAAHLLSVDGAAFALEGAAWNAAYDYYGHDATGVTYADQVLARAISWSQRGFCINCGVDQEMVLAVHAAYGAPVLAALTAEEAARRGAAKRPSPAPKRLRPAAKRLRSGRAPARQG
ncbi:MAG: hypothetical protein E6G34_06095 [Actinobacteria bacterium]|nr:MAG: hypothetical protein E6G34_06095 [Actinomycetota bacterium]